METKPTPNLFGDNDDANNMSLQEPAVAYERKAPTPYDPTLDTYNYPPDYPWAPRTMEELDRCIARSEAAQAAGQYYTDEEVHKRLRQFIEQLPCE